MENKLPLKGIKVLDLSRLLPGPFATQYLSDLGAEVLRVESPQPDLVRLSPPFLRDKGSYDLTINRNKKSINLNLKSEKAKYIFYQLVNKFDIVIEQFRPGVVKNLGIDYESLKSINEEIIYCSLSGYGQEGPSSSRPAHDINYLSEAGFFHDQIESNLEPPFILPQTNLPDLAGGLSAVIGILSAVIYRQSTGKGQFIDISIFDSIVHLLQGNGITTPILNKGLSEFDFKFYPLNGKNPYYTTYSTKDNKFISVGALEPHFWKKLCTLLRKEQFIDHQYNTEKYFEMYNEFKLIFKSENQNYWTELLKDICSAPVHRISDLRENPQLISRNLISKISTNGKNEYYTINQPILFSEWPYKRDSSPPPSPGEHTKEILVDLGYSKHEIEIFNINGVIF